MRRVTWGSDELEEWRRYCRRVYREEFDLARPMNCRELFIVPHRMFIERRHEDGSRRFLALEKGEMVCRSPFDERCGIKSDYRLSSDGSLTGFCRRKHTPIRISVVSFDRP